MLLKNLSKLHPSIDIRDMHVWTTISHFIRIAQIRRTQLPFHFSGLHRPPPFARSLDHRA